MDFKQSIINYSLKHYKLTTIVMVALMLALGGLIPLIQVDTDPENMLSEDEAYVKREYEVGQTYLAEACPGIPQSDQRAIHIKRHRGCRNRQQQKS